MLVDNSIVDSNPAKISVDDQPKKAESSRARSASPAKSIKPTAAPSAKKSLVKKKKKPSTKKASVPFEIKNHSALGTSKKEDEKKLEFSRYIEVVFPSFLITSITNR
jgi:hypothetical protein